MNKLNQDQINRNNTFINTLIEVMSMRNDAALCRVLGLAPPVISKIRNGQLNVGPTLLINAHEESGLTIKQMKSILNGADHAETDQHH